MHAQVRGTFVQCACVTVHGSSVSLLWTWRARWQGVNWLGPAVSARVCAHRRVSVRVYLSACWQREPGRSDPAHVALSSAPNMRCASPSTSAVRACATERAPPRDRGSHSPHFMCLVRIYLWLYSRHVVFKLHMLYSEAQPFWSELHLHQIRVGHFLSPLFVVFLLTFSSTKFRFW